MKKLSFVLMGGGSRGRRYTETAFRHHDCELVAIAEPREDIRNYLGDTFGVPMERRFASWEEVLALGKVADFAMICTQDRMHFEPAMKAIELGYDILLEKPAAPTPEECMALCLAAEKKGVRVLVCHVLRYTPFARKVKEIIDSGKLGKIMTIMHAECVGHIHYTTAFVRGPWRRSDDSSDMLLAKSCHDIDLLQWLLGSQCKKVQSFGRLSHFTKENCPEGAPEFCIEGCPHSPECPYCAVKLFRDAPFDKGGWQVLRDAKGERLPDEEINRRLAVIDRGRCVYQLDNDVVDHQTVNLEYENGETVVFTMSTFAQGGRRIHIMGTKGELISTDFDTIELFSMSDDDKNSPNYGHPKKEIIKTSASGIDQSIAGGHGGGDKGIVQDLFKLFGEGIATTSVSDIRTSIRNHMTVFAAEESRKNGGILVDVDEYLDKTTAGIQW